jgi:ABC-type proline/glycine betaine transport system substrate-binding protein
MHLGMGAVEEMDYAVNRSGKSLDQAARDWMQRNQTTVNAWFAQP